MAETAIPQPMDEILASIRRIIAEDPAPSGHAGAAGAGPEAFDDVLELGEALDEPPAAPAPTPPPPPPTGGPPAAVPPDAQAALLSAQAQAASQRALAALSGLAVDPHAQANTLDGLVRELLRPLLKDWLDAHLPEMVERLVSREVARLSGR